MTSPSSAGSSLPSVSSTNTVPEQVLRKTYKDPVKLRQGLDRLWGKGQYSLRHQLQQLEKEAYQHYDGF
ncbi:hypothetical protein QQZ08_006158 [Neonectria magnoliae]|uniref:Uncharacterized protein n=1 Tax=Neonectria magnoliae TaxID=2732573 RepID=A0ABR1I1L5_9HYPO